MNTYSYLADDFAFGVADRQFLDGAQFTPYHATFVRHQPAREEGDIGTLFTRYIIDDKLPAPPQHLVDEGRALAVAHEASAMILYTPRPDWGNPSSSPDYAQTPVRSLKLSLVMRDDDASTAEIWLGDRKLPDWSRESVEPISVFVRDGAVVFAAHPLLSCNHGRTAAVRLERANGFRLIHFYNYQGEPRTFTDAELLASHNGVVIEMDSASHWNGLQSFREYHSGVKITDDYYASDGMRNVNFGRKGLELAMEVSPISNGIKYRSVNGSLAVTAKFEVSGFIFNSLPWTYTDQD